MAIGFLHENYPQHWSQMLATHRSWLSAVIFARLRDREAVEEVLQETALAAFKRERPVDENGVSRWLYRVAIRQTLLYRRKRGRYKKRVEEYTRLSPQTGLAAEKDLDPVKLVIASEQADMVRLALTELCPRDCEVLLLKYTEQWTCKEIADRLGVSESAIKSRLLRARNHLRKILMSKTDSWELT